MKNQLALNKRLMNGQGIKKLNQGGGSGAPFIPFEQKLTLTNDEFNFT